MASAGYGITSLRHSGHTPAPYAYRGLSASCFALPWRTAEDPDVDEIIAIDFTDYDY